MAEKSLSAIDEAWHDIDKLVAGWHPEDVRLLDELYQVVYADPPTPPASDAHYTDAAQLAQWREDHVRYK